MKSANDDNPISPLCRQMRKKGIAAIWHDDHEEFISVLPDGSHRMQALQVQQKDGIMVLVNTYMPTSGTHTSNMYEDHTTEV